MCARQVGRLTRTAIRCICPPKGALFLQALYDKFEAAYARDHAVGAASLGADGAPTVGKEVCNYVTLLSYLALFEVRLRPIRHCAPTARLLTRIGLPS